MMIAAILLIILSLNLNLVECGVRTQIKQNVRELGRLLSFQRTESFSVNASTSHGIPENHVDIADQLDLLNVRYVLVKNIHASLPRNSTTKNLPTNVKFNKKLLKHYDHKYSADFDHGLLRDMAEQHEFRMEKLNHGQLQFISIAPKVFADIRKQKDINDDDYLQSLAGSMTMLGPLRSQAFFFYTSDQRYMIKFLRTTDGVVFSQTLPDYYRNVLKPNSLLTHIIGYYRIHYSNRERRDTYNVIVIKNSFPVSQELKPEIIFDLKGSTHNAFNHPDEVVPALKDCVFMESRYRLYLGNMRKSLFRQMAADTDYLERAQINDYSLLLGIRHVDYSLVKFSLHRFTHWVRVDKNDWWYSFNGGFIARKNDGSVYRAPNGKVPVYYMSLIDLFTVWGRDRQEERTRKTVTDSVSKAEWKAVAMSNVDPKFYRHRFLDKLYQRTLPGGDVSADLAMCRNQLINSKSK